MWCKFYLPRMRWAGSQGPAALSDWHRAQQPNPVGRMGAGSRALQQPPNKASHETGTRRPVKNMRKGGQTWRQNSACIILCESIQKRTCLHCWSQSHSGSLAKTALLTVKQRLEAWSWTAEGLLSTGKMEAPQMKLVRAIHVYGHLQSSSMER